MSGHLYIRVAISCTVVGPKLHTNSGASGIGSLEEDMQPKSTYAQSIFNSVNLLM